MIDLNYKLAQIESILTQEEEITITSQVEHKASTLRREEMSTLLNEITGVTQPYYNRIAKLPRLASDDLIQWAQSALEMPLAFVVLDTTGLERDADIIRVLVMDANSEVLYHSVVCPGRQMHNPNTRYTGITQEMLNDAPPLSAVWNDLTKSLKGRYVLAYGQDWLQERLDENAKQYGLKPLHMIGACLQTLSVQYFRSQYNQKLIDVCRRIGFEMPMPAMSVDRALGQIALLKAMSQGITSVKPVNTEPTPDEDDHPF